LLLLLVLLLERTEAASDNDGKSCSFVVGVAAIVGPDLIVTGFVFNDDGINSG
jgi:hypothetical protein